jgi:PAS domain-containing protein
LINSNSFPSYNQPVFAEAGYGYPAAGKPGITKEENIFFTRYINSKPHSAWVADKKGHLLYANAAFYKYFGIANAAGHNSLYEWWGRLKISPK